MSDPPIVFKRKSSKPTHRTREAEASADTAEVSAAPAAVESTASLVNKVKNKAKQRTKPRSNLSFGGEEEEGEAFKVKKSSLSQKLTLGKHPASPAALPSSLEQANISAHTDRPVYDAKYLSELKAATSGRPRPARNDETIIPAESSVKAAKEKRERLKKGAGEEYISLTVARREDEDQGPHPESRLVREDDELGEGDDEYAEYTSAQERIALGKKSRKLEASKRREAISEMIEEDDEETQEWVQKQIQRGGTSTADEDRKPPPKPVYKPAPIPPMAPIPQLGATMDRLAQTMTALTSSHARNSSAMTALAAEHTKLDQREEELREMVTRAEEKRSWFVSFREWTEGVAAFLDEKYPPLEKIEAEYLSILKERWDMIEQRRQADDGDDLTAFLGALPVAPHTEPEELDELGRVIPKVNPAAARRDRRDARKTRRTRRQKASNRRVDNDEGYSTDATLPPSDARDYHTAIERLMEKRDEVLADVRAEEFRDPSIGLAKWFGEWRERYGNIYNGAWGGLGLVGSWEFWVRLEILGWSPFDSSSSLDDFKWYSALHDYTHSSAGSDGNGQDKADSDDLVSSMITTTVIPRIVRIIENGGFDPWSAKNVRRVIDFAEELETTIDRTDLKFQMLFKAVTSAFRSAVDLSISSQRPHLLQSRSQFDPESVPARLRLLSHQRKLLSNLLRWKKYAGSLSGVDELAASLVNQGMLPIAESGWDVGGEETMREVSHAC
ncbi:nineteen complex-related protein 2-domain-containing protein [Vararia minispora EC-137]|uniref:Nineteen complex-related protein 2-domain-containing protein n=1 Tax=Vararia minispora EC-137 TaxID=1314806 RepID=A0ACB8QXI8_9AGAM|nr:nineteen complex-related protein 2-domain-containing protein [Vararia minispora EC-137]